MMNCPECGETLDELDVIVNRRTGRVEYRLYICHNEEYIGYGQVYNDRGGVMNTGDPSGHY